MPNLKDIKDRITSIQNTQKITRAMKMVAAAKVKKAEQKVKAGRPFAKEVAFAFARLLRSNGDFSSEGLKISRPIDNYPELLKKRNIKTEGILVVTSSKGLAGAYNANVVRFVLKKIEENLQNGIQTKLFVVGQKGINTLKRQEDKVGFEIIKSYNIANQNVTSGFAITVAEDMAASFVKGEIDTITIVTTAFKNMMSYKVKNWQILPLNIDFDKHKEENVHQLDALMEFEPNKHIILQKVVPMFITNMIYHAFLEANASELASRMTAMSAACNNAEEMIHKLSVDYNKARQGAITQEITEIVSGANAI